MGERIVRLTDSRGRGILMVSGSAPGPDGMEGGRRNEHVRGMDRGRAELAPADAGRDAGDGAVPDVQGVQADPGSADRLAVPAPCL